MDTLYVRYGIADFTMLDNVLSFLTFILVVAVIVAAIGLTDVAAQTAGKKPPEIGLRRSFRRGWAHLAAKVRGWF